MLLILLGAAGDQAYTSWWLQHTPPPAPIVPKSAPAAAPKSPNAPGTVATIVQVSEYTPAAVLALAKQNYGTEVTSSPYTVTQVLFTYISTGVDGKPVTVYARAYIPTTPNAPVIAMAPGTTGIGDECAASLEQPTIHNWGNYESDMMAYASQGYAGVITDYEGMRDPNSIHHYMVGVLEGQAVLDSIRALKTLPQAHGHINADEVFAAGYSQGGHAAFWADTINASYAPDVHLAGIIGWGPVMDVTESLQGITKGSTLDWFGPYLLVSYADYYQTPFPIGNILLPRWQASLTSDVLSHCIDSDISFWGTDPAKVYTPQFLAALKTGNLPADQFGQLGAEMQDNIVGSEQTDTPKLINQGQQDNVILPSQQQDAMTRVCANSRGPASLKLYDKTTHYTVMRTSFHDTLAWMDQVIHHSSSLPDTCK
jgi:alpha-beta hydrolase superfamily lysophospholipase